MEIYFAKICTKHGTKYIERLDKLCRAMLRCATKRVDGVDKSFYGFLTDQTVLLLSTEVSRLLSNLANIHHWGADSKLWSERPIYFVNNLHTDGL